MFDGKFSTANSKPAKSLKLNKRVVPIILIVLAVIILATVLSQQMVSTPITELDSDIVQKDGRNEPDSSI